MKEFAETYSYLFSQIIWFVLFVAGSLIFRKHIKKILMAGVLALPQAFFSGLLIPVYWEPELFFKMKIGIEDFLFSFLSGGLAFTGILFYFSNILQYSLERILIFKRLLFCLLFGFFIVVILYLLKIRGIMNPFLTMILWIAVILVYKPGYLKVVIAGSFTFLMIYATGVLICLAIWPHMPEMWNWQNLWGIKFLGIPFEEFVWAFLYGASWPLAVFFIFDIKFRLHSEKSNC